MNAREQAVVRDLVARARLKSLPYEQIRQRPRRRSDLSREARQRYAATEEGLALALTDRELEMLRHASNGLEASMTAEILGISYETVKRHLATARYKLKAKNTAQACCEAIRLGLIP